MSGRNQLFTPLYQEGMQEILANGGSVALLSKQETCAIDQDIGAHMSATRALVDTKEKSIKAYQAYTESGLSQVLTTPKGKIAVWANSIFGLFQK